MRYIPLLCIVLLNCNSRDLDINYTQQLQISDSLRLNGNIDSSYNLLRTISKEAPDSIAFIAKAKIANLYINSKMYKMAIEEYKDIYIPENKNLSIPGMIAFCYDQLDIIDSAKLYLKKSIQNNYKRGYCYFLLGNYSYKEGKPDSAKLYYLKSISDSAYYNSYNNLGAIYTTESKYDSANIYINKALLLAPNEAYPNYYKSMILYEENQFKSALRYINKAVSVNNTNPNFYDLKANIFYVMDDDSACFYYNKAVSLGGNNKNYKNRCR